jgi:hypothetical protein
VEEGLVPAGFSSNFTGSRSASMVNSAVRRLGVAVHNSVADVLPLAVDGEVEAVRQTSLHGVRSRSRISSGRRRISTASSRPGGAGPAASRKSCLHESIQLPTSAEVGRQNTEMGSRYR